MRRPLAVLATLLLAVAACSSSGAKNKNSHVSIEFWVGWSGSAYTSLQKIVRGYEKSHPNVTVHVRPNQSDPQKVTLAVTSGTGPDLATAWSTDQLGKLCTTGVLTDLGSYEARDHVSADLFPKPVQAAFAYQGKHCALPYLTDTFGLYYNKDILARAGYTHPPRTTDELADMAIKLTTYNGDGSIKQAGFIPLFGVLESWVTNYAPWFGAPYFDSNGKSDEATDPRWTELYEFRKKIIDAIGYKKLKTFAATMGQEFDASNPFEHGKVAMVLDGEWRTNIIASEAPKLNYGTEGLPAPPNAPQQAGASGIGTTLLAIPRGAKHADAAWELARYLSVETGPLVQFANAIGNVPTTVAALHSKDLHLGTHFGPFLAALANPHSGFPTILPQGPVYFDPIAEFDQKWEAGSITDLHSALVKLDSTINAQVAQG